MEKTGPQEQMVWEFHLEDTPNLFGRNGLMSPVGRGWDPKGGLELLSLPSRKGWLS